MKYYKKTLPAFMLSLGVIVQTNVQSASPPTYIIPVVFHVLHECGAENISDAQIQDAMRILNEDFRKLNPDTIDIIPSFQTVAGDAEIEFRLAGLDPNGNCTNGIDRIYTSKTNLADDNSKLNLWPRNKYLNIWTCKTLINGTAGYVYKPGSALPNVDGIILMADYVGSIGTSSPAYSRFLTQMTGHFLNLDNLWGAGPMGTCGDEGIPDTPITEGWSTCPLPQNADVCTPGIIENYQNFEELSGCQCMFTQGQCTKMHLTLNSSVAQRNNLWQPANLTATGTNIIPAPLCIPIPYFCQNVLMICDGDQINFQGRTINATATSYQWYFPGGTPSTDTAQNPTITYYFSGTYDVILTVSNATGSNTDTLHNHVIVSAPTGQYSVPFSEGFEVTPFPGVDWHANDLSPGTNTWEKTDTAHYDVGSWCLRKNNYSGSVDGVDEFISPSYNFQWASNVQMTFWMAFALSSLNTPTDELRVLSSTDCGKTWTQRFTKSGTSLATLASAVLNYVPNSSSDWRQETINLSSSLVSGRKSVRFKFEYTRDKGDNIYIDDINITGTVGVNEAPFPISDFEIIPNPSASKAKVHFSLNQKQDVAIEVFDVSGRKVETVLNQMLDSGEYDYELKNGMEKGIYTVRLKTGEKTCFKKAVIQ